MINPIYESFGVIRIDGEYIRIYKDHYNYQTINIRAQVSHALWNSGFLTVYLMSGEIRRYHDYYYYDIVR